MSTLDSITKSIKDPKGNPPVHLWKPELCGDMDLLITAKGEWIHEGSAISRERMIKLFASVLWFENDEHYLVTPAEKCRIRVEDAPFIVISASHEQQQWLVTTNVGDQVTIGGAHKVELREYQGQWLPYINIRYDLWARVNRNVYLQWVNHVMEKNTGDNLDQGCEARLSSDNYSFAIAK